MAKTHKNYKNLQYREVNFQLATFILQKKYNNNAYKKKTHLI